MAACIRAAKATCLIGLIGLGLMLAACTGWRERMERLQAPEVRLSRLALVRADLLNPVFHVGLDISNPNSDALHLEAADAELELDGSAIAQGRSVQSLELAPHQTSEMELEVGANTLALAKQFFQLQQDGQIDYTVSGHLQLTRWLGSLTALPFRLTGSMTREQLLREMEGITGH